MNVSLNPYGPHSPDYTRQLGEAFAEAVRVLNHATRGRSGLVYPVDVYDLVGLLAAGTGGLDQTARQLAEFLEEQLHAERLAVTTGPYAGKPVAAVAAAADHRQDADARARTSSSTIVSSRRRSVGKMTSGPVGVRSVNGGS